MVQALFVAMIGILPQFSLAQDAPEPNIIQIGKCELNGDDSIQSTFAGKTFCISHASFEVMKCGISLRPRRFLKPVTRRTHEVSSASNECGMTGLATDDWDFSKAKEDALKACNSNLASYKAQHHLKARALKSGDELWVGKKTKCPVKAPHLDRFL